MSDEREVEIPWAVSNSLGPCLDVGCAESTPYLHYLDGPVDGIDVRDPGVPLLVRSFYLGDIRTFDLPRVYRTVVAVSTIEHVGLAHARYGTAEDDREGGDRAALLGCVRATEAGGRVLLSVPYGDLANFGWYRRYDGPALAALLDGFSWSADYVSDPGWSVGGVALVTVCV